MIKRATHEPAPNEPDQNNHRNKFLARLQGLAMISTKGDISTDSGSKDMWSPRSGLAAIAASPVHPVNSPRAKVR